MASRIRCITQSTSRSRKASSFPSDSKSMCGTRKSPKTFGYEPGLSLSSRFGGGFFDRVYGSPIISTPNNRHLFLVLSNRCNRCADARNNHAQKQLSGISGEYYPASSAYLRNNLCTRGYGFPVIHGRFLRCEEIFAATLRVCQSDLTDVLSFSDVVSFSDAEVLSFSDVRFLSLGPSCPCRQFSPPAS
jgi:hypothetical protein